MKVGANVGVLIPGVEDPVQGKVSLISPALDPGSTTVEVWVRVPNPKGAFKAGTPVRVSVSGQTFAHALVVPAAAIVTTTGGKKTVMVAGADNVAHQREVQTGITAGTGDDSVVQILSGVKAGEKIVTVGAYALDDGTKIKIVTGTDTDQDADKPTAAKSGGDN
jgi:RND family efflux transporter MFP subunit